MSPLQVPIFELDCDTSRLHTDDPPLRGQLDTGTLNGYGQIDSNIKPLSYFQVVL